MPTAVDEHVIALERAELDAIASIYAAAPAAFASEIGLRHQRLPSAVLLAVNTVDVLAMNRVLGCGLAGRPTDGDLADAEAACVAAGAPRFFWPVAPLESTRDLGVRLEQRGLRHYNNWIRLGRSLAEVPEIPATTLTIRHIDATERATFGAIVATAYGYPPAVAPFTGIAIGRPGWAHYLACYDNTAIAAAAMYAAGKAAWFGFAATLPGYRGRGAQTALVIRRLTDAARAGCKWISVETAQDSVEHDAPSFRNLRRLGFTIRYGRPNYLWSATRPHAATTRS